MLACLLVGLTVHAHAVMPGLALSQPKQVRGTVTEEGTGQPLVGASVYIKGTTDGTVTSATGAFEIAVTRSEEHTSELQSRENLVCRLLLEKKKNKNTKK